MLIEVSESSLSYDRDVKLPLYARAGIPEVWIVALLSQVVEIYRSPGEGAYRKVQQLGRGETLAPLNLLRLGLPVDSVLG